jgi:hypothetical protein
MAPSTGWLSWLWTWGEAVVLPESQRKEADREKVGSFFMAMFVVIREEKSELVAKGVDHE